MTIELLQGRRATFTKCTPHNHPDKQDRPGNPKIKTICCECGALICDGPTKNGRVSHGYCERCCGIIMAFINGEKIDGRILSQLKTISG